MNKPNTATDVLDNLGERYIMVEHRLIHLGMPESNGRQIESVAALKQLYELCVAEAITLEDLPEPVKYVPVEALAKVFNQEDV